MKDNVLAGRTFTDLTQLNEDAAVWCVETAERWHRSAALVPAREHDRACAPATHGIADPGLAELHLCPRRRISFDGYVSFEGRRFGVPWWYEGKECRVSREGRWLHVYSLDLSREIVTHPVTWERRDSSCEGQWEPAQPQELPSQPVTTTVLQAEPPAGNPAFAKFDFGRMVM